jgi:hypothetical protein
MTMIVTFAYAATMIMPDMSGMSHHLVRKGAKGGHRVSQEPISVLPVIERALIICDLRTRVASSVKRTSAGRQEQLDNMIPACGL